MANSASRASSSENVPSAMTLFQVEQPSTLSTSKQTLGLFPHLELEPLARVCVDGGGAVVGIGDGHDIGPPEGIATNPSDGLAVQHLVDLLRCQLAQHRDSLRLGFESIFAADASARIRGSTQSRSRSSRSRGCHEWSLNGGSYGATKTLTLSRGGTLPRSPTTT